MTQITDNEKKLKDAEIDFQISTLKALGEVRDKMMELMKRLSLDKSVFDELDEVMDVYKTIIEVM
jgi:cytidylate kinase